MVEGKGSAFDSRNGRYQIQLIDTHCHIDQFDAPEAVARTAEQNEIFTIAVTNLPSHYETARERLAGFRYVVPALGMHPLASRHHTFEMPRFRALVGSATFIGEIGLDFSAQGRKTADLQADTFEKVIRALSTTQHRVVTLHSRGAETEVLNCLQRYKIGPAIFHWFSGSARILNQVLDASHYVSVNTAMIATQKWQTLIHKVPRNRIVTETDGPFAKHKANPATPADIKSVIAWLATQWRCSAIEAEIDIRNNFAELQRGSS